MQFARTRRVSETDRLRMPNVELQEATATKEAIPITDEEKQWYTLALSAVPADQRDLFSAVPLDVH